MDVITLQPNKKQLEFFAAQDKYLFYGGAKGGGKSWCVRWKQIHRRLKYPKSRGLLLRRTYPELLRTHIEKVLQELPRDIYKYDSQKHFLYFPNGSVLEFGSCQYEQDVKQYQGAEYDDIGIDEVTQFTEHQFNILKSILRTTRSDLKTQMYLAANPGGVGHGWIKRLFIDKELPDHRYIPAKVYDNPILMQADPDYVKQLENLPETLRRAYLDGDWDIFEGQVFGEWRRDIHVVTTLDASLKSCKKIITFDWGYNAPGCALWMAYAPENQLGVSRVYVYRELYQNQKTPEQWAKEIKQYLQDEEVDHIVLPHDCFSKLGGRDSIADVFRRELGIPIIAGRTLEKDARKNRLALTHQYLSQAADGKPYLQVYVTCRNTIRTLPELVYSVTALEDVDTDGEDHAYDALSLGLLNTVAYAGKSGPVKPEMKDKTITQHFPVDEKGEIIGFDLDKFKEGMKQPQNKSWEYI